MKPLIVLIFFAALTVQAQTLQGHVDNFAAYGYGAVCRVPMERVDAFVEVTRSAGPQDDRFAAARVVRFFMNRDNGECFDMLDNGDYAIDLPRKNTYYAVFLLVMHPKGAYAYWQAAVINTGADGALDPPTVLVAAPKIAIEIDDF